MYVELVEGSLSNRGRIEKISDISREPSSQERYISLFPFDKSIIDWVKVHGSVAGYKGIHYAPYFFFDIDSPNLTKSYEATKELINKLYEQYVIPIEDIQIYFSGAKGFHVGLHEKLFGGIKPSKDVPEKCRKFAELIKDSFEIEEIDTSIYESNRIFRIVNSLNSKTNLYKIPITYDELLGGLKRVQANAVKPRSTFVKKPSYKINKIDALSEDFNSYLVHKKESQEDVLIEGDNFFAPAQEGERNTTMFKQACMLYEKTSLYDKSIKGILQNINKSSESPITDQEIDDLLVKAKRKINRQKEENQVDEEAKPFFNMIDEWYESIMPEHNKLSLFFDNMDYDTKGKLRGRLGSVIGKGGTKKSVFAQFLAYHNIMKQNSRVIYSSMEMSITQLGDRLINMAVEDEYDKPVEELSKLESEEHGKAKAFVEYTAKKYSDNLLISTRGSMTAEKYDKLIEKAHTRYGDVDMLIVDGLSMMGGKGTETELANEHTKKLKEIANKWNIFVMLIVHTNKMGDKSTRNANDLARASEKIIDNSDFTISMSLIERRDSNEADPKYYNKLGFIKLINKRQSGNIIDALYEFDDKRLIFKKSDLSPRNISMQNYEYDKYDVIEFGGEKTYAPEEKYDNTMFFS